MMRKKITGKTILKQGDKIFQPAEYVEGVVYWVDENDVVSIKKYKPRDVFFYHNDNDTFLYLESVNQLCKIVAQSEPIMNDVPVISLDSYVEKQMKEILEQINTISTIEVDEHFNILSYE
jgi:hypothetical protein